MNRRIMYYLVGMVGLSGWPAGHECRRPLPLPSS